jgi:molybdenum cofactor cytidylyltransferase
VIKLNILILAAGEGSRIGTPKWRLKWEGARFMDILLQHLEEAGLPDIYAIISGSESTQFTRIYPNVNVFVNQDPSSGMISSVQIGVTQSPKADAYMIIMVDHPFVKGTTYKTLYDTFLKYPGHMIQPVMNARPGHPVIVPAKVFEKGFSVDESITLHDMIVKSNVPVMKVSVKDSEIFHNVNNREDLRNPSPIKN